MNLNELTSLELYNSTVNAFPRTTRRQNSIDMIKIIEMSFLPYLGMKTLFVKGLAKNIDNQKEYNTVLLFKNVKYPSRGSKDTIKLIASDNKTYIMEMINPSLNNVLVRCDCKDFYWRFNYYNSINGSLNGRKRGHYESKRNGIVANENKAPGFCKHLIKTIRALTDSNIMEV